MWEPVKQGNFRSERRAGGAGSERMSKFAYLAESGMREVSAECDTAEGACLV